MAPLEPETVVETDRRSILRIAATLGAAGVTGLAGCSGGDGGGGDGSDGSDGGGGDGGGDGEDGATQSNSLPRGGLLHMGAQQGVQTMSPFVGFLADYLIGEAMYDRLTRVDQSVEVHPNLATDWEHNDDYTTWTFMLAEGARFTNPDQPVTAEDVKATYDYLTSESFDGSTSSISGVSSVSVVDETTVEFELGSTDIDFPKRIAETGGVFFVVPKSVLDDDPAKLESDDYGSGPLVLTEWNQKNEITFKANPEYHVDGVDGEPLPYIDELRWDILSDEIQRANALADGNLDAVSRLSPKVTDRVSGNAELVTQTSGLQYPIVLNTTVEPFSNPQVRKAVKHALDRTAIKNAVAADAVLGHHSAITPVHANYNEELPVDDTFGKTAQPEKAREMLGEAGFDGGFEVDTFHYDDGVPAKSVIAQLFQQQMKAVGIEFEIQQLTEEKWLSDYWNSEGVWYITNYSTRVLGETVPRLALRSEGPWNEANWSNDAYDEAFNTAVSATDRQTKAENLKRCQEINHREGAWVGTFHPKLNGGHRDYVQNYNLYPTYIKNYVSRIAVDK